MVTVSLSIIAVGSSNATGQMQGSTPIRHVKANFTIEQVVDRNLSEAMTLAEQLFENVRRMSSMQLAAAINRQIQQRNASSSNYPVHVAFLSTASATAEARRKVVLKGNTAITVQGSAQAWCNDHDNIQSYRQGIEKVSNQSLSSVFVTCRPGQSRRLGQPDQLSEIQSELHGRHLQSQTVNLDHTIEIDVSESQAPARGQTLLQTLKAVTPAQLQDAMLEALEVIAPAKAAVAQTTVQVASTEAGETVALVDPVTNSVVGLVNEQGELLPPTSPIETAVVLNASAELSVSDPDAFLRDAGAAAGVQHAIVGAIMLPEVRVRVGLSLLPIVLQSQLGNSTSARRVNVAISLTTSVKGNMTAAQEYGVSLVQKLASLDTLLLASSIAQKIRSIAESKNETPADYSLHVAYLSPSTAIGTTRTTTAYISGSQYNHSH
eukprot:TRINITY_DN2272_c0_g1_i2.p1 TRINITY_DN2272_c0_g1~~TRINITY_DN2272_c0_g1_i2.p1  ORF type:complete len:465 (-),score=88.70 TRINITY_DN2272_c0_g1_i2:262-1566(-)